jgi:hypothetical protein
MPIQNFLAAFWQWVETNPSNIRIFPADICIFPTDIHFSRLLALR